MSPVVSAWVLDLPMLAFAGGMVAVYLKGASRRRDLGNPRPRASRAFLAGCLVLVVALVSPVAVWSGELLWVHMVQHLLLVVAAAPLLALGAPASTVRLGLPAAARHAVARATRVTRRAGRRVGAPPTIVVAAVAHVVVLWGWHTPALYDAAARSAAAHLLEHASFVGTGVWLWSAVVTSATRDARRQALATIVLAALIAQGGVLGALLVFAGRSLYSAYDGAAALSALEDQQLAGALMWVPPGFVYATVAVRRFIVWLDTSERDLARREARLRSVATARSPGERRHR